MQTHKLAAVALATLIAIVGSAAEARGATVRGQVLDAATGAPLEGATVTLDGQPPDGTAEYETVAEMLGLFELLAVAPGTYRMTLAHPAYAPISVDIDVIGQDAVLVQRLDLQPTRPGEVHFPIDLQAMGVVSNALLTDAEFTIERWTELSPDRPGSGYDSQAAALRPVQRSSGGGAAVQLHDEHGVCTVGGPPAKTAAATGPNVAALETWLTAHVAGHAQAATTYTFYDVTDAYLGPWGESGYLIGYGRRYNIAFSTNRTLMADPVAARWVWRTSVFLQEALVDFIMERFRAGTLGALTEGELRSAAFASHAQAYSDGGLSLVASTCPELIPTIASIPAAEFNPLGDTFGATVSQVFQTCGLILPTVVGNVLAGMAGPAHTGVLTRAADQDRRRFQEMQALSRGLGNLEQGIQRGYFDSIRTLQEITDALNTAQFPDQGFAQYARTIIEQADDRKRELACQFHTQILDDPSLATIYDTTQPGWRDWLDE